jgi:hypothetical protein
MRLRFGTPITKKAGTTLTIELSASRISEELLEHYRQQFCKKCELSMVCIMGREFRESFWCQKCKGWWLSEHDLFVRCDGFPGTHTGYYERHGSVKMQSFGAAVSGHHAQARTTIDSCPLCDPQGENELKIIEGFVVEEEP